MSVYYHVASKDEILAALVDVVFGEIELPVPGRDWRPEMERRADSARVVLARHRWAIGLLESRPDPGPANLRHHDTVLATLRAAGFSPELTAHAYALLDSYVYGFALQEASLPFEGRESVGDVAGPIMERMAAGEYPHLARWRRRTTSSRATTSATSSGSGSTSSSTAWRRRSTARPSGVVDRVRCCGRGLSDRGACGRTTIVDAGGNPSCGSCNEPRYGADGTGVVAPPGPPSGWCHGFLLSEWAARAADLRTAGGCRRPGANRRP